MLLKCGKVGALIKKGSYPFQINYFNYTWGKGLWLKYEGPMQELRTLGGLYPYPINNTKKTLLIDPSQIPEMIRGFVNYQDEKRTHTISVGDPRGVHYSYDLANGSLLKVWKGGFANVTEMWEGRGIDQLLIPQAMSIELNEHFVASPLKNKMTAFPLKMNKDIQPLGYRIDNRKRPIFMFKYQNLTIEDQYQPDKSSTGLKRTLSINGDSNLFCRAARADYIEKINEDLINYYIKDIRENLIFESGINFCSMKFNCEPGVLKNIVFKFKDLRAIKSASVPFATPCLLYTSDAADE